MSELTEILSANSVDALAEYIRQRLRGAVLDSPFDTSRGEESWHVLATAYNDLSASRDQRGARLFAQAFAVLAEQDVVRPLHAIAGISNHEVSRIDLLWLTKFFDLLAATTTAGLEQSLIQWATLIYQSYREQPALKPLFLSLAAACVQSSSHTSELYGVLHAAIHDKEAGWTVALLCAASDPAGFSQTLFANFTRAAGNNSQLEDKRIVDVLREMFAAAVARDERTVKTVVDEASALVSRFAIEPWGESLRDSTVLAMEKAEIPSRLIAACEMAYWTSDSAAVSLSVDSFASEREKWLTQPLRKRLGHIRGTWRRMLRVNDLPFAETVYLRLCQVLAEHCKLDLVIENVPWSKVGEWLIEGRLDVAVHNASILSQLPPGNAALVRSPYCAFYFSGYRLIVRRSFLRDFLGGNTGRRPNEAGRQVALKILRNGHVNVNEKAESEGLRELLSAGGRVSVLDASDFYSQSEDFLAKHLHLKLDDLTNIGGDSDEGARALLDGNADFFCGGALHADYLQRVFPDVVASVVVYPPEYKTDVWFFTTGAAYEDEEAVIRRFGSVWAETMNFWRRIEGAKEGDPGYAFFNALRRDLLGRVNRARDMSMAFARSFENLAQTLVNHNNAEVWTTVVDAAWRGAELPAAPLPSSDDNPPFSREQERVRAMEEKPN